MNHSEDVIQEFPPMQERVANDEGPVRKARPAAGEDAIARIASSLALPVEQVRWEFWHAWDGLLIDAKFPDYLLVLTERKALQALRGKHVHH
ncbi:DUF3562 domain-containing protein [Cupriavidus sp. D384]|uniref:DUF3562 domain-containing protein n=1 Tax=Cupriavidus sp. D384 TaxID=1538095 RepID=UPI000AAF71DC|nr:DUF3562 domain-containing protein [Cupriavidus sp. D384]